MQRVIAGSIGLVVVLSGNARADVTRCAGVDAGLSYSQVDLGEMSGDTGWFPSDSDAQLRLTGEMTGQTSVAMGVTPTACWSDGMTVTVPAKLQTGLLDSEYGAAMHLYGQIHTTILGNSIDWSGEIPVPFVPTDLLIAGTTSFDPVLLPDATINSVSVHDLTGQIPVITTDILGPIIDIVGISGGLRVYVRGGMTTSYATTALALGDGSIATTAGSIPVAMPQGGFGPSLTLPFSATGVVHYEPSIVFGISFVVKILGISVINADLGSVEMPVLGIDRPVTLAASDVVIPLPHLDRVPDGIVAGGSTTLPVHNSGLAPLMFEVASAPDGVTAPAVTVDPGSDGTITVIAAAPSVVPLVLSTNDPNHPTVTIALDGATDPANDPTQTASSGCSAGGAGPGSLVVLCVLGLRRRRRTA